MNTVRVLVIADDPLARAGIAMLLSSQPDCTVVGQVSGDSNLAEATQVYRPDVLVWDLGPTAASVESMAGLRAGPVPFVALLPSESSAADAWSAGARGLVLRDAGAEQLVAALKAVAEGLTALSPELASALMPMRTPANNSSTFEALTPRELQVLQLLAQGQSNKEIAQHLGISEHTVKFHVNAILGKLNAQSRTEAVVRATRLGLVLL